MHLDISCGGLNLKNQKKDLLQPDTSRWALKGVILPNWPGKVMWPKLHAFCILTGTLWFGVRDSVCIGSDSIKSDSSVYRNHLFDCIVFSVCFDFHATKFLNCIKNHTIAHLCPLFTQTKGWCFKVISKERCLCCHQEKGCLLVRIPPRRIRISSAIQHNKHLLITSAHTAAVMTFKLLEDFFSSFFKKWKYIAPVDIPLNLVL